MMGDNYLVKVAKNNKVVFVSEDGFNFRVFIDGKELVTTRGVSIEAGLERDVEVTSTLITANDLDTFKEVR